MRNAVEIMPIFRTRMNQIRLFRIKLFNLPPKNILQKIVYKQNGAAFCGLYRENGTSWAIAACHIGTDI